MNRTTSNKLRHEMAKSYHSILNDLRIHHRPHGRKGIRDTINTFHIGCLMSMKIERLHNLIMGALIMRDSSIRLIKLKND